MAGNWRGRPDADWLRASATQLKAIEAQYRLPGWKAPLKKATKPQVFQAIKAAVDGTANPPSLVELDTAFGIRDIARADIARANAPLPPPVQPGANRPPRNPPRPRNPGPPANPPLPPDNNLRPPANPPLPPGNNLRPPANPPLPPDNNLRPPANPPLPPGNNLRPPANLPLPPGNNLRPPANPPLPPGSNLPPPANPPVPATHPHPPSGNLPGGNTTGLSELVPLGHHAPVPVEQGLQDAFNSAWANTSHVALQLNATNARQVSRQGMATPNFDTQAGLLNAGRFYPHRGRGPTWRHNSCALDCCIVAAMFMNVGSTVIDMGSANSHLSVPRIQSEFVRMVNENWDFLAGRPSWERRHTFLATIISVLNGEAPQGAQLALGNFLAATAIWAHCTSAFQQFAYTESRRRICRICTGSAQLNQPTRQSTVTLANRGTEFKGQRPTMQQLLERHFGADNFRVCSFQCKIQPTIAERRRQIHGGLPPRLVVQPAEDYRDIRYATADNITFQYEDENGNEHDVTYRWLGGIYNRRAHYRTYWTDGSTLDPGGHVKIYDGMVTEGSIVGGIPAARPEGWVPASWATNTDILFYERVVAPNFETALGQATTMLNSFQNSLSTPTGTPGSAGDSVTPTGPTSNTPQKPAGLTTPTTPSGTGGAGPSTKTSTLKRGPPSEEEEEQPNKRQQLDPESDPSKVSPKQKASQKPSTSPKGSKSPKRSSRSPKGKGKAVSPLRFTTPTYQGGTRSTRSKSTLSSPSPKSERKILPSRKGKRKLLPSQGTGGKIPPALKRTRKSPPTQGTKRRASSRSSSSKSPGGTKRLKKD